MRYDPATQPAPLGRKISPTWMSLRPNGSWKSAVVDEVTIDQIVYTIAPKNNVMKTSFSNKNLSGATMLANVTFFFGALFRSTSSAGNGLYE